MIVPVTRSKRIPAGRGIDREGIAPDVRIPLPLPRTLTDNVDPWVEWVAGDLKKNEKNSGMHIRWKLFISFFFVSIK